MIRLKGRAKRGKGEPEESVGKAARDESPEGRGREEQAREGANVAAEEAAKLARGERPDQSSGHM
ncbi:CsbD family protein [Streptomyces sp. LX-29]|uniref:CsbD family protein n=1 Tax=Streptomyces sp. LX-29 TaxID=2900152 RepID=UPI00240E2DEA|nr:CsbD family protein [Streptomyces sp. LX-29]WFB06090.1 CsbD family protein [Streptomyces sp. LX-29]